MALIKADYIIVAAFILMLGTHAITQYLVARHTTIEQTQKDVENLLQVVEGNPVAAWALKFEKGRLIYSLVFAPAIMFGMYYYTRRKYILKDIFIIESTAFMAAIMFLINFFKDASYLVGFLLR